MTSCLHANLLAKSPFAESHLATLECCLLALLSTEQFTTRHMQYAHTCSSQSHAESWLRTGLRLAAGGNQLSRTWIVYNKPEEPTYAHAGVLMGLGFTGTSTLLYSTSFLSIDQALRGRLDTFLVNKGHISTAQCGMMTCY